MASERDELVAVVVKAIDVHAPSDWYTDDDHSTEHDIADAIIAAGWRLVPEGSLVVPKSVWDDAYSFIFAATDEYGGGFDGRDKFSEGHDILYRMIDATHPSRAALKADADA